MKKLLILGVIALFIGLAFIPSFNAVSISKDIGISNPVIVVHVTEMYGSPENPQYRNLPNVTVKIKEGPLWWKTYWSGKTHENGTTEQVNVELGFLYKIIVSKQGYIVFNDDNYAVVGPYEIKEYHVYFTMVEKKVKDIENDCLECQSNGKKHLAEKILNKAEKNKLFTGIINSDKTDDIFCNILMKIGIKIEELYKQFPEGTLIYPILVLMMLQIILLWNKYCD